MNNISKPQNKWYEFFIDPVRFIGNYSSGKQGILIAEELEKHGCDVQIIAGYVNAKLPKDTIFAYTANKMLEASSNALPTDIYISVAAICDFKPKSYFSQKIKKSSTSLVLELENNIATCYSCSLMILRA